MKRSLPVVHAYQHEAAAADIAAARIDDRERVGDGDRRIDRVSAGSQHVDAGMRRIVLLGGDHRVARRRSGEECGARQRDEPPRQLCAGYGYRNVLDVHPVG